MGLFGSSGNKGKGRAPQQPQQQGGYPQEAPMGYPPQQDYQQQGYPQQQGFGGGDPFGGYPPQDAGYGPQGGGGGSAEKTQAIDITQFNKNSRQVVGWLVARNGNHRGQDFKLFPGKNVIGTAADCDLVVTDPYLSARHTTVRYENGKFVALDLDSKNGTYVNQKRISKEELIDNDTVRLGKTEFKFKSLD